MVEVFFLVAILCWILACPRINPGLYNRCLFRTKRELGDASELALVAEAYGGQEVSFASWRGGDEDRYGYYLHGWVLGKANSSTLILYCMGRDGDIPRRASVLSTILQSGARVFIYESAGYGKSQGRPTLDGLFKDARAALKYAQEELLGDAKLILYGQSIGTILSCYLLRFVRPAGLILKSGFTGLERVAKDRLPIMRIYPSVCFPFMGDDLREVLTGCHIPTLIIHGKCDRMVDWQQAVEMFTRADGFKRLILLPNSRHGFMPAEDQELFGRAIGEFVAYTESGFPDSGSTVDGLTRPISAAL